MFKLKDTGHVCMSAGDAFLEPKRSAGEHMKHFLSKLCVDRTKTSLKLGKARIKLWRNS